MLAGLLLLGVISTRGMMDLSGSGMSDVWETIYGFGLDPDADPDGDGYTNREEAAAGTNPHDPASYPRGLSFLRRQGDEFTGRFPSVPGLRYQVETSGDLQSWYPVGAPFTGTGADVELTLDLTHAVTGGEPTRSVWTGLSGSGVNLIKGYVVSNTPPTFVDAVAALEVPPSNPNQDQFGQFIRGWLLPPVTGAYTFWIASDDGSELWLSTDADPANVSRIAWVTGWTSFRQWIKYPEQQSAPVLLATNRHYYFEVYQRESGGGDHLSVAWTRPDAAPDAREIIAVPHLSADGRLLTDLEGGPSLVFRVVHQHQDSDGDGLTDYEELLLGLNPALASTKPRQADADAALAVLDSGNTVTVGATIPRAYEAEGTPGRFTIYRDGNIQPLTIAYTVGGSAVSGIDYQPLAGSATLAPGARSVDVEVIPLADGLLEPAETVTLHLVAGHGYALGTPASATVTIDDAADVLYVAALRPPAGVVSAGYGYAVIRRAGNGLGSVVRVSYGALSGEATATDALVSSNGLTGVTALALPTGQIDALPWDFAATNGLLRDEVLAALDGGSLWLRLRSAAYPSGELIGRFLAAPAWDTMPDPPTPATAPTAADSTHEAARFLVQATFGPTPADVATVTGHTYAAWIDAQLALPPTYHWPYVEHRRAELLARSGSDGWQRPRQEAWWQQAIDAPDQLRQRVAWALSQIVVISQFGALDGEHVGITAYYDMLVEHAFGNFRDLLENVTLSPMMGTYLSMMRNRKPDPVTGHEPDENFAREIMQLFSIGLMRMHPDGSLMLDAEGMPIPTYTQDDIVGLAHIFTGWSAHYDPADPPRWSNGSMADPEGWFQWGWDALRPMSFYGSFHDQEPRTIAGGVTVPGGTNGVERLRLALDALFHHPNVGPFIARQLIQRFITSNPGPGYVYRVAYVFNDNGAGVRGDLGAVIKAVLLDPDARDPAVRASSSYGKPIEPVMRLTRMFRRFRPDSPFAGQGDARLFLNYQYSMEHQVPLYSPSVFNFYQPVYSHPGRINQAGLLSPEFQIFTESTAINDANLHYGALNWGIWTVEPISPDENAVLRLNLNDLVALLQTPDLTPQQAQALVLDELDATVLAGAMTPSLRAELEQALASLPAGFGTSESRQRQRAALLLYLVYNAPEFLTQR